MSESESLDEELRSLMLEAERCITVSLKTMMSGYLSDWSDEKLREIAKKEKFPKEVFEKENWKAIIVQFFNFYFSGELKGFGDNPCPMESTVFSAISLLNVSMVDQEITCKRVFEAGEYMSSGDSKPFYTLKGFCQNATFDSFEQVSNRFRNAIKSIIKDWDIEDLWKDQVTLMRLTAFLALTLCRAVTNQQHKLMADFRSKQYRDVLRIIVGWEQAFESPHPECINKCISKFNKQNVKNWTLASLFAIIGNEYVQIVRRQSKDGPFEIKESLLYDSLLSTTADNGLPLVTLMIRVLNHMKISFDELMSVIGNAPPRSIRFLKQFEKKFYQKEYGYRWARLIDDRYLKEYSARENIYFCAVFAKILEYYEGPGIWQSAWAKNDELGHIRSGKIQGEIFYHILLERKLKIANES